MKCRIDGAARTDIEGQIVLPVTIVQDHETFPVAASGAVVAFRDKTAMVAYLDSMLQQRTSDVATAEAIQEWQKVDPTFDRLDLAGGKVSPDKTVEVKR